MEGLLEGLVGWPEAEVTAVLGLAALGGMAEGEGVVLTFFLGAIFEVFLWGLLWVVMEVDWSCWC